MFSKFALIALLVASVSASGGYSSFSYGVSDPNTGDIKDQHEKRVGGNVVGKYSLLESDGTKRVVEYSADDATGFKAVVHKEPAGVGAAALGGALAHGALAQPGALAAPLAHAAPLANAAPLAAAHANPWAAGVAQAGPLGAVGSLAHGAYGALANPLGYGNAAGIYGQAGLYGGYGNPLAGPLGQAGHGAPTVSSYSHRIVHNGPGAFPYGGAYGGAYGRYGAYGNGGYGAHGAALAGAHLAGAPFGAAALSHANPWANNAALANPWANGASLAHGGLASPLGAYGARGLGYSSQLGW